MRRGPASGGRGCAANDRGQQPWRAALLRAFAPILRDNARLVVTSSGFGLLKNLPENLRPRFDTRRNASAEIDRAMDDYVAAPAEHGRLEAEGWPAWVNTPSKIGQVAVARAFAREYAPPIPRESPAC